MSKNTLKELLTSYSDKSVFDTTKKKTPECLICNDEGLIEYTRVIGGFPYRYYAHCTCSHGKKYAYEGKECENNKSDYRMPGIDEILTPIIIEELKKENEKRYAKKTKGYRCQYVQEKLETKNV